VKQLFCVVLPVLYVGNVLLVDSSDVRKGSLLSLIKKAREEQPEVWNEYFNAMLLILLETVADDDVCEMC